MKQDIDFRNTKWDVRNWTDEMKQAFNEKAKGLGFNGLTARNLNICGFIWLEKGFTMGYDTDDEMFFNASENQKMKYTDMFPDFEFPTEEVSQLLEENIDRSETNFLQKAMELQQEHNMMLLFTNGEIIVTLESSDVEYKVSTLKELQSVLDADKVLKSFER